MVGSGRVCVGRRLHRYVCRVPHGTHDDDVDAMTQLLLRCQRSMGLSAGEIFRRQARRTTASGVTRRVAVGLMNPVGGPAVPRLMRAPPGQRRRQRWPVAGGPTSFGLAAGSGGVGHR